ncbi:MAG: phytanoyl-CoA dioxygenase family protein [Bordetella sp.]|uniref:phytanoyl-CoA dioxygenase family protein n=1 Tax=Bordetella sp. TaxID=28081 RepID=UPI003F7C3306
MTQASEIDALREQGFVVVRGFAEAATVSALRELAQRHLDQAIEPIEYEADLAYPGAPASREVAGGQTARRLLDACGRDPQFARWATSPRIAQWLSAYFERAAPGLTRPGQAPTLSTVHHNCVMTKHPHYGSLTGWHQDIRYWSFSAPELVSCWLALGRETADNGGLFFLPGSHAAGFTAEQFDEKKFFRPDMPGNQEWIARAVCPELEPGDAVFFHCLTLHAAQRNASDAVKLSLVHTYHPDLVRPLPGSRSASRPGIPLAPASGA